MSNRERERLELKEAHRRSAERVQRLLEELEIAEREFAGLTEKMKALPNITRDDILVGVNGCRAAGARG